jgi:Chitobiase/beta-hexosaminidase C-terminal domain/Galactose oxidase, central domain
MGGSSTIPASGGEGNVGNPGIYGKSGTPAAGNIPGGRNEAMNWTDSNGNFWLFGGWGYDANDNEGLLNDLWEFNPSLGSYGEWAWMGGSSTFPVSCDGCMMLGQPGVYGAYGKPVAGNIPGGRNGATGWTDSNGNFWLFGGQGLDANGTLSYLNDLWVFNSSTKEWTWMSGNSTYNGRYGWPAEFGTLGAPAPGNNPGAEANSNSWTDSSGHFWLFGGWGIANYYDNSTGPVYLNDLWEYQPSSTPPSYTAAATPVFLPASGFYTTVQSVGITDTTPGALIYYTTNGTTPTPSSTQYTGAITVSASETVQAIAVATNYYNSAVATATYTIQTTGSVFNLTLSPPTLTIPYGQTGVETLTITPLNGYQGTVNLVASGSNLVEYDATGCMSGPNVAGTASGYSVGVTAKTILPVTFYTYPIICPPPVASLGNGLGTGEHSPASHPGPMRTSLAVAGLLLVGLIGRRSRKLRGVAGFIVLVIIGLTISSCSGSNSGGGGGGSDNNYLPKGTYPITIIGTDSANSSLTNSTSFTLVVD